MIASAVSTNLIQQAVLERKKENVATLLKVTIDPHQQAGAKV